MFFGGHVRTWDDTEFLKGIGLDFGELVLWNATTCNLWLSSGYKNEFADGFFLLAHGPNEGPPNNLDNLWNKCYPALCKTVDVTAEIGINLLVVHLWMDHRFIKPAVREEKKQCLRELCDYAAARQVLICLENLSESAEDLVTIFNSVPDLGLTLDVGHGQLLAETNTSFGIIEELFPFIRHVHIHDNEGGVGVSDDLHLPVGEGVVDFQGILGALINKGFDGTLTLEVEKDVLEKSFERIKHIIHSLPKAAERVLLA